MEQPFSFRPWTDDAVEYVLNFREHELERARQSLAGVDKYQILPPRISLPRTGLDCLTLDNLKDHPMLDPLTRKQLEDGVPFRLVRVPWSLMPGENTLVTKARLTLRLGNQEQKARVHSIYPVKLEVGKETSKEVALAPKFSIGSVFEISAGQIVRSFKVQQSQSLITGLWGEGGADWILRPVSDQDGLEGTWDFLVIIRWLGSVSPLPIFIEVDAMVMPRTRRLFVSTKHVHHKYSAWDARACRELR